MSNTTLFTFLVSHFSEKARWALDLNGVSYEERRLAPVLHIPVIRRRAKRTSVPVLEHEGEVVQGSTAILDFMEERLGATKLATTHPRARELEEMADRVFGRGSQTILYGAMLGQPKRIIDVWSQAASWWVRPFYAVTLPFAKGRLRAMYDVADDKIAEAKDAFRRAYDELDPIVEKQPYLLGDAMTRVDVSVAALLALVCRPPEYPFKFDSELPEPVAGFLKEMEERPTSRFALRMYREHRR